VTAPPRGKSAILGDQAERAERIRAGARDRWEALLPQFTAELEAVGGVLHRAGPSNVASLVSRIARERRLSRVVTWSESVLGLPGLLRDLGAAGLEAMDGSPPLGRPAAPEAIQRIRTQLERAEVGVTGVDFAVAESGSLVLLSGPGKGRLTSCLPTVHVAILRPGQLVETLDEIGRLLEASHLLQSASHSPSGITFITGPSRTADIELSLTRGVHGPGEVHVIAVV
jgi:L-lactate dehydrogenase complex protein LldG